MHQIFEQLEGKRAQARLGGGQKRIGLLQEYDRRGER